MSFCGSDQTSTLVMGFLIRNESVMFGGLKLVYLGRSHIGPFSRLQWSLCRQASYLYIKQRYNPSNIYISQPCRHMNLLNSVGGILVPCAKRLYRPVLTLWMYLTHYKSGILQSGCFFDQISRSTPKPAVDIS